jgi:ribosomal protein S27AE
MIRRYQINVTNPYAKRYVGALPDRKVPPCPRCGHTTCGWPTETVGLTYAGCSKCGKLFNR